MLLRVVGLKTEFRTHRGAVHAVDDVSFSLDSREILGLVGETGSGKSATAMSIINLIPFPGRIVAGQVFFMDEDLLRKSPAELRGIRGKDIAMVVQNARQALNPLMKVGKQLTAVARAHQRLTAREADDLALEMLRLLRVADPMRRMDAYPHELSGGMAQRVLIAMALICQPRLIIADEPTTGLDVTVQLHILNDLADLARNRDVAILLVTHDLGIVAHFCDSVAVMYGGRIVEKGPARSVFSSPQHPYTATLIRAAAGLQKTQEGIRRSGGGPPDMYHSPLGCAYRHRCPIAEDICASRPLDLREIAPAHAVRCHFPGSV